MMNKHQGIRRGKENCTKSYLDLKIHCIPRLVPRSQVSPATLHPQKLKNLHISPFVFISGLACLFYDKKLSVTKKHGVKHPLPHNTRK
jgi:hypothetical protein